MLWSWDAKRVTTLVRQCIRIGYHPRAWKTAKAVKLRKPNKLDYTMVKLYYIISLLNCLRKMCEKVVADILSEWCEINYVLYEGQMGFRRQRSTIDTMARVISRMQEA